MRLKIKLRLRAPDLIDIPKTTIATLNISLPRGKISIQEIVPNKQINDSGTMYFQQSAISWSTRTRGKVALTHIATKTQR